jgi:hypothetical protein
MPRRRISAILVYTESNNVETLDYTNDFWWPQYIPREEEEEKAEENSERRANKKTQ